MNSNYYSSHFIIFCVGPIPSMVGLTGLVKVREPKPIHLQMGPTTLKIPRKTSLSFFSFFLIVVLRGTTTINIVFTKDSYRPYDHWLQNRIVRN